MDYASIIDTIPDEEKAEVLKLLRRLEEAKMVEAAREKFMPFVQEMWPGFIGGRHHGIMAEAFERVAKGESKRLIINLPPRFSKSEFSSYLLPAWFLGKFPQKKVIQASHTADLAVGFGRKVRNLVDTEGYRRVFPGVGLVSDSKAAGRWSTNKGGEYFAIGVGGAVTGKGADLLIIDDPHALEVSTPIPTPNGFVEMRSLKVGDEVYGPDGLPTKVIGKSEVWDDRPLYRVTDSDGEYIDCDAKHLWGYYSGTNISLRRIITATAEELAGWSKPNKPILPLVSPVQYPARHLPIDPWVLGAWLGDGTSSLGRFTAHPDDQPYVRGEVESAGYVTTTLADSYSFGVLKLRADLIDLGVLNNKHIPEIYMVASVEQRMALLQGLMDTDGGVDPSSSCSFSNGNRRLSEGVVELLHSLGVRARILTVKARHNCCEMYIVNFRLKDAARMPRKACRTKTPTDKRGRSISVQRLDVSGAVQCITVERSDGLFLAGRGYMVTHNSEQDAVIGEYDPSVYDKVYEWYTSGPRQRLQPGGAICIVQTRWSLRDLTAQVLKSSAKKEGENEWEVIEFPAIMPSGQSLWPEFWSTEELLAVKADLNKPSKWNAQYMQSPSSEEGALIKRDWWNVWEHNRAPTVDAVIIAMDTAFEKTQRADYSACVTFGIFMHPNNDGKPTPNLILLDAWKEKLEFPELKATVLEYHKRWKPDMFVVEKKASGGPLVQELRRGGIPVAEFTPTRATGDKIVRVNAITDIFASGVVWAPDEPFSHDVIEECAAFPSGEHDDYVDAVTMAMMRFRQGGFTLPSDDWGKDDEERSKLPKKPYY